MENLHKAVLMFILRRTKAQVLKELPPKIIQDIICEMSPLQKKLYSMASSAMNPEDVRCPNITDSGADIPEPVANTNTSSNASRPERGNHLKILSTLKRISVHPGLVLNPKVAVEYPYREPDINNIAHSGKFLALQQLLIDGGLGPNLDVDSIYKEEADTSEPRGKNGTKSESVFGIGLSESEPRGERNSNSPRRRFLIFAQLNKALDMVEEVILRGSLKSCNIRYLRMDGKTPEAQRPLMANRFNNDSSIDLMLLTTHVGGLGLTLTGADTVVFLEHDWNPQNDIQAMDRAHRIGQTKTVMVYRLITKGSIEEQIMSTQQFKLHLANTIVSTENLSMKTMDTNRILDAFQPAAPKKRAKPLGTEDALDAIGDPLESLGSAGARKGKVGSGGIKKLLEDLGDLSDEEQYQEFNLTTFIQSLKQGSQS